MQHRSTDLLLSCRTLLDLYPMCAINMICVTTCIKAKGNLFYSNTGASKSFYGDTDLSTRIWILEYTITLRVLSNGMCYCYLIKAMHARPRSQNSYRAFIFWLHLIEWRQILDDDHLWKAANWLVIWYKRQLNTLSAPELSFLFDGGTVLNCAGEQCTSALCVGRLLVYTL